MMDVKRGRALGARMFLNGSAFSQVPVEVACQQGYIDELVACVRREVIGAEARVAELEKALREWLRIDQAANKGAIYSTTIITEQTRAALKTRMEKPQERART